MSPKFGFPLSTDFKLVIAKIEQAMLIHKIVRNDFFSRSIFRFMKKKAGINISPINENSSIICCIKLLNSSFFL